MQRQEHQQSILFFGQVLSDLVQYHSSTSVRVCAHVRLRVRTRTDMLRAISMHLNCNIFFFRYAAMVNMQQGHRFIRDSFGAHAVPTIGWQIDPFGHSAATPRIYASMGYKAMVLGRPDWRTRDAMQMDRSLEFWWGADAGTCPATAGRPSTPWQQADRRPFLMPSENERMLFTHMLHTHYQAPDGFDFSYHRPATTTQYTTLADRLVKDVKRRRKLFRTDNVLMLIGDDFRFVEASNTYIPLDAIIDLVNEGTVEHGIWVQYSLPSDYFAHLGVKGFAAHAARQGRSGNGGVPGAATRSPSSASNGATVSSAAFPCHEGHLLPYEDKLFDNNWSGYYSSRPTLKSRVRELEATIRTAKMLDVVTGAAASFPDATQSLDKGLSLNHHHDAITGTCTDNVAKDYFNTLHSMQQQVDARIDNNANGNKNMGARSQHGVDGRTDGAEHQDTTVPRSMCHEMPGAVIKSLPTFECQLGLANALAHTGQSAQLVEISIKDLFVGRIEHFAHAEEMHGRHGRHAPSRKVVAAMSDALSKHRWSCVIHVKTGEVIPSQIVDNNPSSDLTAALAIALHDKYKVALLATVDPWAVGGYKVYVGNPDNAPQKCRAVNQPESTVEMAYSPVVVEGEFKRVTLAYHGSVAFGGIKATVNAPGMFSSSNTDIRKTTELQFSTHEYRTYSTEDFLGQTGSGHYVMKSAVTIFLRPMIVLLVMLLVGCLAGMHLARSGTVQLHLQIPPNMSADYKLQHSHNRSADGSGVWAWCCCFLRYQRSRPSRNPFATLSVAIASLGWGFAVGVSGVYTLLQLLPNPAVGALAGAPGNVASSFVGLAVFAAASLCGGGIAGIGVGHVMPVRGMFSFTLGIALGGAALLFGRPDLHARQLPIEQAPFVVERGALLSRVTWQTRSLKSTAPISHTLTVLHGSKFDSSERKGDGGSSKGNSVDSDQILIDHDVTCLPNTEVIFRMHASESSSTGSGGNGGCSWHERGSGYRRVTVDNGLLSEPHVVDPWALLPRNYFAAVGFASISGGLTIAAELPAAVVPHSSRGQLPPPKECLDWDGDMRIDGLSCGMTVHTKQALGVASVASGTLDVVLHRRLMQADQKGISEVLNDMSRAHVQTKLNLFEQPLFSAAQVEAGESACAVCEVAARRRRETLQFSQGLTVVVPPPSSTPSASPTLQRLRHASSEQPASYAWKECVSVWAANAAGSAGHFEGLGLFEVFDVQVVGDSPPKANVLLHLLEPAGCTSNKVLKLKTEEAEKALSHAISQCARGSAVGHFPWLPVVTARIV